ncbi:hypothetical protein [Solirubrum puertoriconensis]|uniref:Uncharacterized protein n=1 Tax=Solirubrum puertoriconensis TaxID=1751427 RepID=A0A9X0HMJ2_SOLP1|nr:hypothetical protein [Solirubrum puertoriconensis]KUG08636.1 hypothetical protein ASU33_10850 [Solirubrum puertoriconensis]
MLRFRLTSGYAVALLALMFLTQEVRMSLRMLLMRAVCGCWGNRTFSEWESCATCAATEAGQLGGQALSAILPYAQMWVGYKLLDEVNQTRTRAFGLALVFAGLPLARLSSATLAAGPETYLMQQLMGEWGASWLVTIILVLLLVVPPAIRAHDALMHPKRGAVFLGMLLVPLAANAVVVTGVLNPLLHSGVLVSHGPLHMPWLAMLWLAVLGVVLVATCRCLNLGEEANSISWLRHQRTPEVT